MADPVYPLRLQKFLARAGAASRRGSEDLMTAGRVTVNGTVVTELGSKVDPAVDEVCVDGIPVLLTSTNTYLMLNKPAGFLTTMDDPHGRPTIKDLVPHEAHPGLFPVGRLDCDTTGLLLFMTDGELAHTLLHPRHKVVKRYRALVDGALTEEGAARLRKGVVLHDGLTQPALIEVGAAEKKRLSARERLRLEEDENFSPWQTTVWCSIVEGRKRQVKRMFAHIGHPVLALEREAFGPLELGTLEPECWRYLTTEEVTALRQSSTDA
jgi:23S rRNA pseudouridine2605 synthase